MIKATIAVNILCLVIGIFVVTSYAQDTFTANAKDASVQVMAINDALGHE